MIINGPEEQWKSFALLQIKLNRLIDGRLARQGSSIARARLLLYLDRAGPRRATDIADFFGQALRTVTEAIEGLERQGLARRDVDADDRRVKQVSLTDAGRAALHAIEPTRQRLIEQIFGTLSLDEGGQLVALLGKLTAAVDAQQGD